MKSLKHYLTESARTYAYTIKFLGEPDKEFLDKFKTALKKFDPEKIEDTTVTPIQKDPFGFPGEKNSNVTIIKAEFKYPATEPMIRQIAKLHGFNENHVIVVQTEFNDSVSEEKAKIEDDFEGAGKQASKDYANQYLDKIVPKKPTFDYKFAGKETPVIQKKEDKIGTKSPFTSISRASKPVTNSSLK